MDRFNRRRTFLFSVALALFFLTAFTILRCIIQEGLISESNSTAKIVSIFLFISHQMIRSSAPSVLPFFIAAEITPQCARSTIAAIAMAANGLTIGFEIFIYPMLDELIGFYSILIIMVAPSSICLVYLCYAMIETKGKTSAEIVELLKAATKTSKIQTVYVTNKGVAEKIIDSEQL